MNQQNNTIAQCPCCGRRSHFIPGGIQRWPARVAEKCGLPTEIHLWHCQACQSTISENRLQFEKVIQYNR